ncbi:MAG: phosphatidylserine/phosphatidylglycerophosphate/cardiolipin synthase family protein [Myxococcales bacterium]|nr:phosphatidylserine/phosphatidylglycerophosphate/cardiolipin synthase family protein [Myxococcales bacterium]
MRDGASMSRSTRTNFRRALVFVDHIGEPTHVLSALASVAPTLSSIVIVAGERVLESLAGWREVANSFAPQVAAYHAPHLPLEALAELARTESADLLVVGGASLACARLVAAAAQRAGVALLWPAGGNHAGVTHVFCAALGRRSRSAIAAFLREQASPSWTLSIAGAPEMGVGEIASALDVLGVRARATLIPHAATSLRSALAVAASAGRVDLIVLARVPAPLLIAYDWPAPVLVVPTPAGPRGPSLDVCDAIELRGRVRVHVDEVTVGGGLSPAAGRRLALVTGGQTIETLLTTNDGELDALVVPSTATLGIASIDDGVAVDAMTVIDQRFAILRPVRRVALFDAELSREKLERQREVASVSDLEPLGVRMRPTRRVSAIRERLRAVDLPTCVIDARAVLDEGVAFDVAEANDAVRLGRVGARLRSAGYDVVSLFHPGLPAPEALVRDDPSVAVAGNRVDIELDNKLARARLLDAIAQSDDSVNVQVYMAQGDEVGAAIESAIADAGARGVVVRVLVDSLHGMHGSFGSENPLLARMAQRRGVEVRASRPVASVPTMADIKQRDHRKLVVVDERVALVGGRNLGNEYYTGFDEVSLETTTSWRRVPWLDGGVRIEGPAVTPIAESFLQAWTSAGGAPFALLPCSPAGTVQVRVVDHHGLRDARTLEAYLELIDGARSQIRAVNGFPYVLELQHALVRAIRRGVRVRALTGHVIPRHNETPFTGPWSFARATVTEFVHSRLDPIVEAGGEAFFFALEGVAGWHPALGRVFPHVHAKIMSIDGARCAVGSANLDVTSAYWESELMVIVEDAQVVQQLEARIDELIAGSARIERDDSNWRERARRRSWMRRWPGPIAI